jgi:hypothetical protein
MNLIQVLTFARIVTAIAFFATVASGATLSLLKQIDPGPRILDAFQESAGLWEAVAEQMVAAPITIGFAVILAMMGAGVIRIWLA